MLHLIVFLQEHAVARFVILKKRKTKNNNKKGSRRGPGIVHQDERTNICRMAWSVRVCRVSAPSAPSVLSNKAEKAPPFFLNGFAASSSKRRDNNRKQGNLLELRKFRFTGTLEKKIPQWLLLFLQFRFQMNNGENGTKLDWSQRATS